MSHKRRRQPSSSSHPRRRNKDHIKNLPRIRINRDSQNRRRASSKPSNNSRTLRRRPPRRRFLSSQHRPSHRHKRHRRTMELHRRRLRGPKRTHVQRRYHQDPWNRAPRYHANRPNGNRHPTVHYKYPSRHHPKPPTRRRRGNRHHLRRSRHAKNSPAPKSHHQPRPMTPRLTTAPNNHITRYQQSQSPRNHQRIRKRSRRILLQVSTLLSSPRNLSKHDTRNNIQRSQDATHMTSIRTLRRQQVRSTKHVSHRPRRHTHHSTRNRNNPRLSATNNSNSYRRPP